MNDYFNTMSNTDGNTNNSFFTQNSSIPVIQYNAYQEAYKMIGSLLANVAKIFTR